MLPSLAPTASSSARSSGHRGITSTEVTFLVGQSVRTPVMMDLNERGLLKLHVGDLGGCIVHHEHRLV